MKVQQFQYQLLRLVVESEKLGKENEKENIVQKVFAWSFLTVPCVLGFLTIITMAIQNVGEPLSFLQKLPYILIWIIGSAAGMAPMATVTLMESWGEKRFQQTFYQYFNLRSWILVLKKEDRDRDYDDYNYQRMVDSVLEQLAQDFLSLCQNTPPAPDPFKLTKVKEIFWHAHNLAWALGFSVQPKLRDYVKKEGK